MGKNIGWNNGSTCTTASHGAAARESIYISLLSSSPCRAEDTDVPVTLSPSGGSPLPLRKRPSAAALKLGSRATPIPQGAVTGFQKASALVLDSELQGNNTASEPLLDKLGRTNKPNGVEEVATSVTTEDTVIHQTIERLSKDVPAETIDLFGAENLRGSTTCDQTSRDDGIVEWHQCDEDLGSVARKETPFEHVGSSQSSTCAFEDLNGNFGYNQRRPPKRAPTPAKEYEGKIALRVQPKATKLRATKSDPKEGKKAKAKASPKKPLTITARAIEKAQDAGRQVTDEGCKAATFMPELTTLNFAQLCENKTEATSVQPLSLSAIPQIAVASSVKKKKRQPSNQKQKQKQKPQSLLSPSSAIQHMNTQNFIFGTCSQNERDEEANFQLQLGKALKASVGEPASYFEPDIKPRDPILCGIKRSRSLASIGARGEDSSVLAAEPRTRKPSVPLFTYTSEIVEATRSCQSGDLRVDDGKTSLPSTDGEAQTCSSSAQCSKLRLSSATSRRPKMLVNAQASTVSRPGSGVISDIMKKHASTRATAMSSTANQSSRPSTTAKSKQSSQAPKPKAVAAPVSVEHDIAQNHLRGGPSESTCNVQDHPPERKKRVQGQPSLAGRTIKIAPQVADPLKQVIDVIDVDEIEDNDAPTPSPPRLRSPNRHGQLELSPSRTLNASAHRPREEAEKKRAQAKPEQEIQQKLLTWITSTVRSAPRSQNPKQPNWHEKILLYDPIVLEDFTEWLSANTSNMRCNDDLKDVKIQPTLVQKWCQKNGVCCLWKKGN